MSGELYSSIVVTYDATIDAAYLYFRRSSELQGKLETIPVDVPGAMVNLDVDADGVLFGLEVIDASKRLPRRLLDEAVKRQAAGRK